MRNLKRWLIVSLIISAGLLYAQQVHEVIRGGSAATAASSHQELAIVLLGKKLRAGQPDHDFVLRLERTAALLKEMPMRTVILSGGGIEPEAQVAHQWLIGQGAVGDWKLETQSRNTQENLANVSKMMPGQVVSVVSSRYHLARVKRLARVEGIQIETIGAEEHMSWSMVPDVAMEALYLSGLALLGR